MWLVGGSLPFRQDTGCSFEGLVVLVKKCEGANTGLSDSIPPLAPWRFLLRAGSGWFWTGAAAFLIVSAGRMQAQSQPRRLTD